MSDDSEKPDLRRWAVVGFKDETGLGRMAQDVRRVLGIGRQIVIPSERVDGLPAEGEDECIIRSTDSIEKLKRALEGLQGLILLERCAWHPELMAVSAQLNLATVCVPMWEWFRGDQLEFARCTLFACPTQFTLNVVRKYGFENSVYVQWALDLDALPKRSVKGQARIFIHNAGLIDHDDRKGTRDTIEAFKKVKRQDLRLIIRLQKEAPLPALDERIHLHVGNIKSHSSLYEEGDVAIQPSKMEGLGFMVLEPVCTGIPVITTDYPPMNEFVQQSEMRVQTKWFRRKAFPTQWVRQAHLKLPRRDDLTRKIEWCAERDMSVISSQNRQFGETEYSSEMVMKRWTATFAEALRRNHA